MNLLKAMRSHPTIGGVAAVILGVATIAASTLAWGPARQTYTMANPADHPVFNSITDNPNYGDEREFVTIKDLTTGGSLANSAALVPGHEYQVQIYVHNNAASNFNASGVGVARGTTVRAGLPASVTGNATVNGFVKATNASLVYDTAALTSATTVNLQYVAGSAVLHTNFQQTQLSDSIMATDTLVGDQNLSGDWRGCLNYAGAITFRFKVTAPVIDKDVKVCEIATGNVITIKESEYLAHPTQYADQNSSKCQPVTKCEIGTGKIVTIPMSQYIQYKDRYADPSSPLCNPAPVDPDVTVCNIKTGAIQTIKKSVYEANKANYASPDSASCHTTVCEISTKKVVTITKEQYAANPARYTDKSSTVCNPAPAPANELPRTGLGQSIMSLMGVGALAYAGYAYLASRRV